MSGKLLKQKHDQQNKISETAIIYKNTIIMKESLKLKKKIYIS